MAYGSETQVIEEMVPPRGFECPTNGLGKRRKTRKQVTESLAIVESLLVSAAFALSTELCFVSRETTRPDLQWHMKWQMKF